jgi:WD40 repeat protein
LWVPSIDTANGRRLARSLKGGIKIHEVRGLCNVRANLTKLIPVGPVSASMPNAGQKRDLASPHAKSGVSHVQWSHDGTLFFSRLDSQPSILHIHSFLPTSEHPTPIVDRIAQVEFSAAIKAVQWSSDPKRSKRLAVVTGGGSVYFWDGGEEWENGAVAEAIGIPGGGSVSLSSWQSGASFSASDLIWAPDGQALAVIGKDQYCMVYDSLDEDAIPPSPSTGEDSFASA